MKKFLFILLIAFIFSKKSDLDRANEDPFCKLLNNNTAKRLCIKLKDNHKFDKIKDLALNSPEAPEEAKKICYKEVVMEQYFKHCNTLINKILEEY